MHQDEELHAELLTAFREYFEANQRWLNKGTRRAGMDVRRCLSNIRRICSERRKVVMDWRYEVNEKTQAKKANQNTSTKGDDSTN